MLSRLGRLAHSRLIPPAVLAGIYIYLLALLIPFLRFNNLLKGDGAGHLMLVEFTAGNLLPFGSGWCDRVWTGFPAGQLYPPLFHVLAAFLSYMTGPSLAIKVLIVAIWLTVPVILFVLAGHLAQCGVHRCPLLHASLLLVTWSGVNVPSSVLGAREALGTNIESSVANGMYPSALGFLFFLFVLWLVIEPRRPRPLLLGAALAATVLSHPVWAMIAALAAAVAGMRDFFFLPATGAPAPATALTRAPARNMEPLRTRLFLRYGLAAILAFCLSAFFIIPMLLHADLMDPIHLPSRWGPGVWAMAVTALVVIGWRWRRMPPAARLLAVLALAVVMVVFVGDRLGLRFHLFRLTVPMMFLLLPAFFAALHFQSDSSGVTEDTDSCATPPATGDGRLVPLLRFGNFVMALVLTGIFHAAQVAEMKGNPELPRLALPGYSRVEGRIMALAEEMHTPGYMALPYGVVRAGGAVSHGISVESAQAAQAVVGMVTRLNPGVYTWGVDNRENPVLQVSDPELNLGRRQLDLLGFSHLLTDRIDRIPPWATRSRGPSRNRLRGTEGGDAPRPQGVGGHVDRRRASRHVEGGGGPATQRTGMQRRPNAATGFVAGSKAPVAFTFPNFVAPRPEDRDRLSRTYDFSRDGSHLVFRLHPLGGSGLVDATLPFLGVPEELLRKYAMLWFANGAIAPVPVAGLDGEFLPDHRARVAVTALSDSGDRLEIERTGGNPVSPIYVKVPWHPHWEATDESGARVPLYRAGLGMLALAPPGKTTLQYRSGWCDLVGTFLTLLALGCLVSCAMYRAYRHVFSPPPSPSGSASASASASISASASASASVSVSASASASQSLSKIDGVPS